MAKSQRGKLWVSNDETEVNIRPDQLPEYESQGYIVGRLPFSDLSRLKRSKTQQGRIWVNNGQRQTLIRPEQLAEFEANGYQRGMLPYLSWNHQKIEVE